MPFLLIFPWSEYFFSPLSSTDSVLTGHYIKDIDRSSPAERAGLKEMDRLVAVEGEEVDKCTHDQVVNKIRQYGNKCCLLVVDELTDKMYKMVSGNKVIQVVLLIDRKRGGVKVITHTKQSILVVNVLYRIMCNIST